MVIFIRKYCSNPKFLFVKIIEFWPKYCLIQKFCYFIHYFRRYGHFRFDIKRFCAFSLLFCVKIDFVSNYFVIFIYFKLGSTYLILHHLEIKIYQVIGERPLFYRRESKWPDSYNSIYFHDFSYIISNYTL